MGATFTPYALDVLTKAVARCLRRDHSLQAQAESAWYADATIPVVRLPLGTGALDGGSWFWTPQDDGTWRGSLVVDGREAQVRTVPAVVVDFPARVATAIARHVVLEAHHGQ